MTQKFLIALPVAVVYGVIFVTNFSTIIIITIYIVSQKIPLIIFK